MRQRTTVMTGGNLLRVTVVSAQLLVLIVAPGCESGSPIAPTAREPSTPPSVPFGTGAIGGTVTINGEARPIVWVEVQRTVGLEGGQALGSGFPVAYGTTIRGGTWEWANMPAGDYVVVIRMPPGLTCDAKMKPATVERTQRTIVNFACAGDIKGSIVGFALNEFGTNRSARVTLTGPVNREITSNGDGFFAFEDLPPGEYIVGPCNPVRLGVRDGATAFGTVDCS